MLFTVFILVSSIYILGIFLTIVLFHGNISKLVHTDLCKKIIVWVPITIGYILLSSLSKRVIEIAIFVLICVVFFEFYKTIKNKQIQAGNFLYSFIPIPTGFLALLVIIMQRTHFMEILLVLGIASSLADVCAFFLGKFIGIHQLPVWINQKKSWEGVSGEFFGALLAVILLHSFVFRELSLMLWIPIGAGSALGDIYNSFLKRRLDIVSWSNYLPGHGGFTDRFVSLSGTALCIYLLTFFTII